MKRSLLMLVMFMGTLFLLGCTAQREVPSLAPTSMIDAGNQADSTEITKNIPLQPFDEVDIDGNINAAINAHQPETQLYATGNKEILRALTVSVKNGILNIRYGSYPLHFLGRTPVKINLNLVSGIHKLVYEGGGQLTTNQLGDDASMAVKIGGEAKVTMHGNLTLSQIEVNDNAHLNAYWLNSSNLQLITTHQAQVFLAGLVDHLTLIASGDSIVDAKYLQVNNAYVRTLQNADVATNVKHLLSSWSTEKSTLYSYRRPEFGTYYLADKGAFLDMVGLPKN